MHFSMGIEGKSAMTTGEIASPFLINSSCFSFDKAYLGRMNGSVALMFFRAV